MESQMILNETGNKEITVVVIIMHAELYRVACTRSRLGQVLRFQLLHQEIIGISLI